MKSDRQFLQDLSNVVPATSFASEWKKENEPNGGELDNARRIMTSDQEISIADTCFDIKESDVFSDASKGATALRGLMAANTAVLPEGIPVTEQQRRRLEASSYGPWKRAPNTSTSAANAESLVAKSLLNARPSVFSPPASSNLDLTELHWDEEGPHAHWPIDDETVFYRMAKLENSERRDASLGGRRNKCFDLNIVMPLVIPGAEIRVLNSDGENYYNLADNNPGAHILFGRRPGTTSAADGDTATGRTPVSSPRENCDAASETAASSSGIVTSPVERGQKVDNNTLVSDDPERFSVAEPPSHDKEDDYPSACDIWASFLHVHLGVIKNCRPDQISEICAIFSSAFSDELAHFMVPVTVDARGIFSANVGSRSQKQSFDKYETHASFLADNDRKRFRIIRRRLKKFVLLLWDRFGVISEGPRFEIALTDNCRTDSRSFFRIEIHRYGQLTHPGLLEHLQRHSAHDPNTAERTSPSSTGEPIFEGQNCPAVVVQSRAVFSELRLEMTHARTVDPRWNGPWVLARRMPAFPIGQSKLVTLARHVFCDRVEMSRIVYEFNQPRQTLLLSRFAPLFLLAEVAQKQAVKAEQMNGGDHSMEEDEGNDATISRLPTIGGDMSATSPFAGSYDMCGSKLSATAVPFFPLNTVMKRLTSGPAAINATGGGPAGEENGGVSAQRSAWDRLLTSAGLPAPVPGTGSDFDCFPSSPFFSSNVAAANAAENSVDREGAALIAKLFHPSVGTVSSNLASNMSPNTSANEAINGNPPSPSINLSSHFGAAASSPLMKVISNEEEFFRPITREPCKFYASGDCMRGENCYFLHPADPKLMTTKSDIRHLSPVNPLYF